MRAYFLFLILFGLWSTWANSKYKAQIRVCSFVSVALVLICSSTAYFMNNFYVNNSLSNAVINCMYIFVILTHWIIIVESICQKSAQTKLIQNLSLCDEIFKTTLKVMIQYRKEKCKIFTQGFGLISILLIVKIIIALYAWYRNLKFAFMYPAMYTIFILRLRPIQIIGFVYLLQNRLILIVEELKDIQNTQSNGINQRKSNCCRTSSDSISSDPSVKCSIYDRLINLKQIYSILYETSQLINQAFGYSLLISSTQIFVDFTSNCYWGYLRLQYFRGHSINLFFPDILLLCILAFYCTSCFQYVSNLFNRQFGICSVEEDPFIVISESSYWSESPSHSTWQGKPSSNWFDSRIFVASVPPTVLHISKWIFQYQPRPSLFSMYNKSIIRS